MNRLLLLAFTAPFIAVSLHARETRTVNAAYTYYVPETVSLTEAKHIALQRAKIQAIADEFGTAVSQVNATRVMNNSGNSSIDFMSVGNSDVKGEWIETIGEPAFDISYEGGMLAIAVSVQGRIRELANASYGTQATLYCNTAESRSATTEFQAGDSLYLGFQSPVDGFLLAYLVDYAADTAYCLLPYSTSADACQKIEHDRKYLFFSPADDSDNMGDSVDEYVMTCGDEMELDEIVLFFAPQEMVRANAEQRDAATPRQLSYQDFNKWSAAMRLRNPEIQTTNIYITIKKRTT